MDERKCLPEETRLALYRIYQEMMTNVLRHANARHVQVQLRLDEREVTLQVSDDGNGFEPPEDLLAYARQGHLGLAGMRERAEILGGRLELTSLPGQGATVRVRIPNPASPPASEAAL